MPPAALPSLSAIAQAPAALLAEVVALCLSPTALPVLARALDLGLLARLARSPATLAELGAEFSEGTSSAQSVAVAMSSGTSFSQGAALGLDMSSGTSFSQGAALDHDMSSRSSFDSLAGHMSSGTSSVSLADDMSAGTSSDSRVDDMSPGTSSASLELTVTLACAFNLLARHDGRLAPTELTRLFLLQNSPLRLLGLVERHRRYIAAIAALPAALRETRRADRRVWSEAADAREQAAYFSARRAFNEASRRYFWDSALLLARAHAARDLRAHRVVCDIGAGPAAFAAILQRAAPHLQVHAAEVNYQDPEYLATTAADLQTLGAAVTLHAINVLHEPLPPDIDLLTANRLFSGLSRDGAEGWARRLFAALAPGGTLALVDFFATGDVAHDRSLGALVALWMAWNHHELRINPPTDPRDDRHAWGWNPPWRCDELAALLRRVGFRDVRARSVIAPFALVEARRP